MAPELANRNDAPMPCPTRMKMIHNAPSVPVIQVMDNRIENTVKTANPRLYMRTRPYMSPTRPKLTTSTAVTNMKPIRTHRK